MSTKRVVLVEGVYGVSGGAASAAPYFSPTRAVPFRSSQVKTCGFPLATNELSGRITIDSSPGLRVLLLRRLESPSSQALTVDFSEVACVGTSGVAILG